MAYVHPTITADTTLIWVDFWNNTFGPALEAAINDGADSGALAAFLKNGRLVDTADTDDAPELPSSPALSFTVVDGTRVYLDGTLHTADGDQEISADDHPNFTGWLKWSITYDEPSESWLWDATWHLTKPDPGSGIIGKIVTDSTTVVSLDSTREEADVIPALPLLLQWLADAEGGGGGGGGGVSQSDFDALAEQVAEQAELIAALQEALGTGTTTTANDSPHRFTRESMVLGSQVRDRPDDFPAYPGSIYARDVTGSGEETTVQTLPDVRDGGDWSI